MILLSNLGGCDVQEVGPNRGFLHENGQFVGRISYDLFTLLLTRKGKEEGKRDYGGSPTRPFVDS